MTPDELRERQAPLKARYKDDPKTALVTLSARGRVDQATVTCVLESGKPGAPAGLHPAAGGDGTAACSGELLLEALVSCAGVTLAAVATAMSIVLTRATVEATGELDFRGTLGVARDAPVGFLNLTLRFAIECDAAEDKVKKLIELTERYCVVLQTLVRPPRVEVSMRSP
jgi:uncharacterized OsmC-like protein